ncbi:unnamed protein product [Dicrocoelium dendriticum]|nr:unnamed protein product [Dicrocoelium dendriticum]
MGISAFKFYWVPLAPGVKRSDHQVRVAHQVAACFTIPNPQNYAKGEELHSCMEAEVCCEQSTSNRSRNHAEHYVFIRVPYSMLKQCAVSLRPDLKDDERTLDEAISSLTPGQLAWLSELTLRSYAVNGDEFSKLLRLICHSSSDSIDTTSARPNLFALQQLGVISEVALSHNQALRRQLWRDTYGTCSWYPNADALRVYFGDSVGFYFTWMRTYSLFLLAPTVMGVVCYLVCSLVSLLSDGVIDTDDPSVFSSSASPWLILVHSCFTLFTILWALVCTKLWSRQYSVLVEHWSGNPLLERITNDMAWMFTALDKRPQYRGELQRSRITGRMEVHFPARKRRLRYLVSTVVILTCLLLAGFVHVLLLNLEGYVTEARSPLLYFVHVGSYAQQGAVFDPSGSGVLPYLPGIFHSLLLFVMNQIIFYQIAQALTEFENHEGNEAYNRAFVVKRFFFEALDAYGCLAYLGFVLADREALQSLLLTMLITDCARRFCLECLIPFVIYRIRLLQASRDIAKEKRGADHAGDVSETNNDSHIPLNKDLCADVYEPFDDYLEMVLQHGYLVTFAYVCPMLAPSVAFLSTFVECHSDALKMLLVVRRPLARPILRRTFIWLALLAAQAWLSIPTNVGLFIASLHTSSEDLGVSFGLLYLLLEHGLVLVGLAIHFFISDVPVDVRAARHARELKRNKMF